MVLVSKSATVAAAPANSNKTHASNCWLPHWPGLACRAARVASRQAHRRCPPPLLMARCGSSGRPMSWQCEKIPLALEFTARRAWQWRHKMQRCEGAVAPPPPPMEKPRQRFWHCAPPTGLEFGSPLELEGLGSANQPRQSRAVGQIQARLSALKPKTSHTTGRVSSTRNFDKTDSRPARSQSLQRKQKRTDRDLPSVFNLQAAGFTTTTTINEQTNERILILFNR